MSVPARTRDLGTIRAAGLGVLTAAILMTGPLPAMAQPLEPGPGGCELCHSEVELLRQHVPTLARARALLATRSSLDASAHSGMACADCHQGFGRFPHDGPTRTDTCPECHQEERDVWGGSVHSEPDREGETAVPCAACHGIHDAVEARQTREAEGMRRMNALCVSCHEAAELPDRDPHAGSVPCAACHAPHGTRDVDDPASRVAPLAQEATCGSCHEEPATRSHRDVHGAALEEAGPVGAAELELLGGDAPPACTSCHGGHDMATREQDRFEPGMVERCGGCHVSYRESYFGTYHGKATALGSEIVATCDACHGSHEVYPASEPVSAVSEANLVETCRRCHEHARAAFVRYDSHPDPMDRSRNPPLFYSFVFMNTLLVGVLAVFGLHTFLWWVRLLLDRRRGVEHGVGASHE